jgi:hypothetical protein
MYILGAVAVAEDAGGVAAVAAAVDVVVAVVNFLKCVMAAYGGYMDWPRLEKSPNYPAAWQWG